MVYTRHYSRQLAKIMRPPTPPPQEPTLEEETPEGPVEEIPAEGAGPSVEVKSKPGPARKIRKRKQALAPTRTKKQKRDEVKEQVVAVAQTPTRTKKQKWDEVIEQVVAMAQTPTRTKKQKRDEVKEQVVDVPPIPKVVVLPSTTKKQVAVRPTPARTKKQVVAVRPTPATLTKKQVAAVPPTPSLTHDQAPHPFWQTPVDNREYAGFIIHEDLGDEEIQIKLRNKFWHNLKMMTGSVIRVKVQPLENAEEGSKAMQFMVCNYATVRGGRFTNQDLASIDIVSNPGVGSSFKFHIVNAALAAENRVDLNVLMASCEIAFSTLLIRHRHVPGVMTPEELKKIIQEKIAQYDTDVMSDEDTN